MKDSLLIPMVSVTEKFHYIYITEELMLKMTCMHVCEESEVGIEILKNLFLSDLK